MVGIAQQRISMVVLTVLAAFIPAPLEGQSLQKDYAAGLEAYERGQWELATQEFEGILKSGYQSEAIYYNLGNSYFRAKNVAGAVWAFERALTIDAGDKDARHNLALARLRVVDRLPEPELPFIVYSYRSLRSSLTPLQWVLRISWLLAIVALLMAGGKMLNIRRLRGLANVGWLATALLAMVAADAIYTFSTTAEGIIYSDPTTAYSAPSDRGTTLFELHEGAKVSITGEGSGWLEIEILDGRSGWVRVDQVRPL